MASAAAVSEGCEMARVRFRGVAARSLSYVPLSQSNFWLPNTHIEEAERWFSFLLRKGARNDQNKGKNTVSQFCKNTVSQETGNSFPGFVVRASVRARFRVESLGFGA